MDERLTAALARLPATFAAHVELSAAALLLGLAVSLPLALIGHGRRHMRWLLLVGVSLVQTIPGLALLALFYPLLLGLSALAQNLLGTGFSALGFLPALLALTLYSMLPIVRNTIVGLDAVPPAVVEAARGVGMTDVQALWRVKLPLAAPVILAGVRTSAVWVIGTATLATPVGQTSLGDFIFSGLQTENWVAVIVGCVSAAGLAMAADQLLGLVEHGLANRSRGLVLLGVLGLLLGGLASLAPAMMKPQTTIAVGAKTFTEQYILANLLGDRLEAAGFAATRRTGLGSAVILRALAADDIQAYVDYSGTIWANAMGRTDNPGRAAINAQVTEWLKRTQGVVSLGGLGFENAYALAMRRDVAEKYGIRSIADLAAHASAWSIGGDYEFFERPEWKAIRQAYGLHFRTERAFQSNFLYRAVADGDVNVIAGYTTDGRIATYDLLVLDDPRQAIPPYDALLLVSPGLAGNLQAIAALQPLIGSVSRSAMQKANAAVDSGAGSTPAQAARLLGAGSRPAP